MEGRILFQTRSAILFVEDEEDPGAQVWLPIKWVDIELQDDDPRYVIIHMPGWLAKEKGFV